jgi:hypothetical protein
MPYTDFTLESAEARFDLVTVPGDLFPGLTPLPVPDWLRDILARGQAVAALVGDKARSEFLVAPVLLACRDLVSGDLAIFSGQRLDVDAELGLTGECDYILALTPPVPRLRAPLVTVVEAKRGEIELGLGQCLAQMVGTRLFNEHAGCHLETVFGVVTTGDVWQFLRLEGTSVTMHRERLFIDGMGRILAALQTVLTTGKSHLVTPPRPVLIRVRSTDRASPEHA